MKTPLFLLLLSLAGVAAALLLPGLSDLILVTGPASLAALWLLLRAPRVPPAETPAWIVIDGSNVMHWGGGTPRIEPVREVVRHLEGMGFRPGVVFDANAGYLIEGRYRHDFAMGKLLGLPENRVMVVDNGAPADPVILQAASDLGARVVSNDRFRDWAERFPDILAPGFLVRGGYRRGRLWLDTETEAPATQPA